MQWMRFSICIVPRHYLVAAVLAILTFSTFLKVRENGFVGYDDPDYLASNPIVRQGLTREGLTWAFGKIHGEQTYWHPLTWVSHMLDVQVFGMNAAAHHLVSLSLHTANAVLLFLVLRMMTGSLWRSAMVAALFAVHPIQVESVAWATERKNVLSTLFGMFTLYAYIRYVQTSDKERSRHWYILSTAFFALGLMCKPALVPLPGVLLLLDYWPLNRLNGKRLPVKVPSSNQRTLLRTVLLEKIPFFIMAGASSIITMLAHRDLGMLSEAGAVPKSLQWANVFLSYVKYVANTIIPTNLAAFYPFPRTIDAHTLAVCIVLLAGITAMAVVQRYKRPYFLVGWLWFIGVLVPAIGVVHVGIQAMADRFAYVPIIGLFLCAVWSATDLLNRRQVPASVRTALATIIIAGLVAISWRQIGYWKNDYSLFERARTVTRNNYMAYTAVGGVLLKQGQWAQAMEYFRIAREMEPTFADVYFSIGVAMSQKGQVAEAITNLEEAVRLKPFYPEAQLNLALMLQTAGQLEQSIAIYEQLLRVQPRSDQAHLGIGNALMTRGRVNEALDHLHEAIRLNPQSSAAMARLAWILATHPDPNIRDGSQAVRLAEQSCNMSGYSHTESLITLSAAYAENAQFSPAVHIADQALRSAHLKHETHLIPMIENLRNLYQTEQPHRESLE
jgi:protein O-mannosyl-transferase